MYRRVAVCDVTEEKVLNTYRGAHYRCMQYALYVVCAVGHSDAVLSVASHPTSGHTFITTSKVRDTATHLFNVIAFVYVGRMVTCDCGISENPTLPVV